MPFFVLLLSFMCILRRRKKKGSYCTGLWDHNRKSSFIHSFIHSLTLSSPPIPCVGCMCTDRHSSKRGKCSKSYRLSVISFESSRSEMKPIILKRVRRNDLRPRTIARLFNPFQSVPFPPLLPSWSSYTSFTLGLNDGRYGVSWMVVLLTIFFCSNCLVFVVFSWMSVLLFFFF